MAYEAVVAKWYPELTAAADGFVYNYYNAAWALVQGLERPAVDLTRLSGALPRSSSRATRSPTRTASSLRRIRLARTARRFRTSIRSRSWTGEDGAPLPRSSAWFRTSTSRSAASSRRRAPARPRAAAVRGAATPWAGQDPGRRERRHRIMTKARPRNVGGARCIPEITCDERRGRRPAHRFSAGVGKRFGGVQAVTDVDLEVVHGERRAILGPNGAGKTRRSSTSSRAISLRRTGRSRSSAKDVRSPR